MALTLPEDLKLRLSQGEREWLESLFSPQVQPGKTLGSERKLRLLDELGHSEVMQVQRADDFAGAAGHLQVLEKIGEETIRLMIDSSVNVTDFLHKIARDFDRGDELGEFRRIYEDIRAGTYE